MMVKVAPVDSSLARSCAGQFHRPTPKPISLSREARHSIGWSRQIISAQAASWNWVMSDLDIDVAVFNFDGPCFQVDAGGRAGGFAGAIIEGGRVFGAFDGPVHHQPAAQMHMFMAANAVHGEKFILGAADDDEGLAAVIKTDQLIQLDVGGGAGAGPGGHLGRPLVWLKGLRR